MGFEIRRASAALAFFAALAAPLTGCAPGDDANAAEAADAAAAGDALVAPEGPLDTGPVLVNAAARRGLDLSGSWTYSIDPYRDGLYGFHGSPSGTGHQRFDPRDVDAATREAPTALFEYDMRRSPSVTLPSSWLTHDEALRHYNGLMWYQRTFEAALAPGERAFLYVEAANYDARVYLNGALVGRHEGGFTPFAFEVTDVLTAGANTVTLGVDSERSWESVPPPVTDWETYGGVTRPVRLVVTAPTFVDDAWVRLGNDGRILATVRLDGPDAAGGAVTVRVPELDLAFSGEAGPDGVWSGGVDAPAALALWSPDTPKLYDILVEAGDSTVRDRVGFRTIAVDGEDVLLNGEPIFLRGISVHEEEFGANPTRAITPAAARALLSEVKDGLHGNFVRLAHYPHSEVMTRTADEMGLLVWSEVPVYWRISWENPETLATARRMLAENIRRDRNRASIVLWSIANETPLSDARNAFLATLAADVRALDDTRLVTAALLTERDDSGARPEMVINDPLIDHLDVMAINTYNGWYSPDPLATLPDIVWRSDHGKPLIFSEFGAGALAGFHDPELMRKFSEEYQAEYYRQTLAMSETIPFLRGMTPWILKDFRSPRRQHPILQQGWNRKGVVSETGRRKQAFFVLADHYARLEEAGVAEE